MTWGEDASGAPTERGNSDRLVSLRPESQPEPRLLTRDDPESSRTSGPPTRPRRRLVRGILFATVLLAGVAAALTILGAIWSRRVMRAALPQIDGTISISGLRAPVTVTRNAQGVPSITATSIDDLLFAQGYVTAQDRLWQMDALRRHAAGELAEILGPALVEHDKMQRYLQLRAAADRGAAALPADQRRELEAYARGVNAFIDTHRDRLPLEFHLLRYTPRPWTPRDSLLVSLVMWQDLSTSFVDKLDREMLAHHLPQPLLADLYPVGSWRDHPPTQPPDDLTAPHPVEQIPLDRSQSRLEIPSANPNDLLALGAEFARATCDNCRAGSNNWAVSGALSASGRPLVSNDMHLALQVPDIWYEAALHLASATGGAQPLDVAGFTLPGLPWIIAGRNAHVAWSFTNLGGDVQDLRIEHLRGSGSSLQFERADGTWAPVTHRPEHILVRGGRDISLDVLTVAHTAGAATIATPIISPVIPSERRALSLAWTVYDPTCLDTSLFEANSAVDGASLVASFAGFGGPSLNLVYADDQGHIGYQAIGRIPIRGAPIQHPRAQPQFVLPAPEPESDEDESDEQWPPPLSPAASAPARVPNHRDARKLPPAASSQPQIAPEPTGSYTIGSPISPVPVDALDASQAWSGYIPYDALPAVTDPSTGIIATANSRVTTGDYPYALTNNWADPYRVERIYHLLEQHTGWTPQQMLAVQLDRHSEFDLMLAQRLAYAIDRSSAQARGGDSARLRQAADLLRKWEGEMGAGSPAASIVSAAHGDLWFALLVPQIVAHDGCSRAEAVRLARLYSWGENNTALEDLLEHMPRRWLPHGVANWSDLLTTVVEQGLHDAHAPRDLRRWQYGAIHRIDIEHPLFAGRACFNWLLGAPTGSGAQPAGGDMTTIDATARSFGPSERFTADLASPSATIANIVTGESGNVGSPWYLDQLQPWLRGTTFGLPLAGSAAVHSLTLTPAR